jgi:hypothetical protein
MEQHKHIAHEDSKNEKLVEGRRGAWKGGIENDRAAKYLKEAQ